MIIPRKKYRIKGTSWKHEYQKLCWDLIVNRIYREGLEFKADNLKILAAWVGLSVNYLYMIIRRGQDGFRPDCSTIHKILEQLDPMADMRFMFHSRNVWALNRAKKAKKET